MIDLGTMGKPSKAMAATFVTILDSLSITPARTPS